MRRPYPLADDHDPLALVRDAVNALYARADLRGDEGLKHCARLLLTDIAKRRRETGILGADVVVHQGRAS